METTYGHRILSDDDEYFLMDEEIINLWKNAVRPSLLDISPYRGSLSLSYPLPSCLTKRHPVDKLPSWFPGAWHVQYIRGKRITATFQAPALTTASVHRYQAIHNSYDKVPGVCCDARLGLFYCQPACSVLILSQERGIAQPSFVSQFLSETMADGQLSDAHIHDVEVLAHQLIRGEGYPTV